SRFSGAPCGVPSGAGAVGLEYRPKRADRHPLGHEQCSRNSQTPGRVGRARARRDTAEIERSVAAFARPPNGGLLVAASGRASLHRARIITLAARPKLPTVYFERSFVAAGGLVSYGPDQIALYRRAPGYADRTLKGEKPAALPVQAPT